MPETTSRHQSVGARPAGSATQDRGIDLDPARRPGVPRLREPAPLPNTRYPPARQRSDVPVLMHGRPHKTFPPVFGTAVPPRGISGRIRRAAYRCPDHMARHWTMLMFADRVDLWEHRAGKLLGAAAVAAAVIAVAGSALALSRR